MAIDDQLPVGWERGFDGWGYPAFWRGETLVTKEIERSPEGGELWCVYFHRNKVTGFKSSIDAMNYVDSLKSAPRPHDDTEVAN